MILLVLDTCNDKKDEREEDEYGIGNDDLRADCLGDGPCSGQAKDGGDEDDETYKNE